MLCSNVQTYVFDGTFYGLLTAVFESYDRRHTHVRLIDRALYQPDMFAEHLNVHSDKKKAERVWTGLKKKISAEHQRAYYCAFLSEQQDIYQHLFGYARYIFDNPEGYAANYGNEDVLSMEQMAHKVEREKHRMKAFIRFKKSSSGLFVAVVEPDYNVLPLIIKHFRDRYTDQPWLIYDERRQYGIHYDLAGVQEVTIDINNGWKDTPAISEDIVLDEKEALYSVLWKVYFKSTNIEERRNMKLHIRHVPKRYWRNLTEKDII